LRKAIELDKEKIGVIIFFGGGLIAFPITLVNVAFGCLAIAITTISGFSIVYYEREIKHLRKKGD